MHSTASFPYLVDFVLRDLEEASRIRIECRQADEKNHGMTGNLLIVSVNGCASCTGFLHLMEHLRAQTTERLRENLAQVSPADLDAFFNLLLRRLRKILNTVVVIKYPWPAEREQQRAGWCVKMVDCRCVGDITSNKETIDEVVCLTRRYAKIYYLELKKLEERFNSLAGASLAIFFSSKGIPAGRPGQKFRLSCTVAFFCAMLRILCDRNIVENPNIAELCRRIAASCSTARHENLSPQSLRNCFDDPSPETLEELLAEVRIWEKYIIGFIGRQRS